MNRKWINNYPSSQFTNLSNFLLTFCCLLYLSKTYGITQFKKKYNVPILFIYCRFSFKYEHLIRFFLMKFRKFY